MRSALSNVTLPEEKRVTPLEEARGVRHGSVTELYVKFPNTCGFPAAQQSVFVWANMTALAVWVAVLIAVRQGIVVGLLPLWFLGFAELLNLFLHPYLALRTGGYYSGVVTAPLVGVLGIMTIRELARVIAEDRAESRRGRS